MRRFQISLLLTFLPFFTLSGGVRSEHLSKKNGLCGTIVSDLFQDREGFVWIGTWEGLCRYDGYEFLNFSSKEASSLNNFHNRVEKIYQDKAGNIWIMTYNGHLHRVNKLTGKFEQPAVPGNPDIKLRIPLFASDGSIWVAQEGQGVLHITTDSVSNAMTTEFLPLENVKINNIFEDSRHTVWIASEGDLKIASSNTPGNTVIAEGEHPTLAADAGDMVVWGTDEGHLIKFDYNDGNHTIITASPGDCITSLTVSKNNDCIYAGTKSGKLLSMPIDSSKPDLLKDFGAPVSNLMTDSGGKIWISHGSDIHILHSESGEIDVFSQNTGSDTDPLPFPFEMNGDVWVCIAGGGIARHNVATGQTETAVRAEALGNNITAPVKRLLVTSGNTLWVSTERRGLDRITLTGDLVSSLPLQNVFGNTPAVKAIFNDTQGDLWIGTKTGTIGIFSPDGNLKRTIDKDPQGKPLGKVYDIDRAGNGTYWIATRETGLLAMKPGAPASMQRYRHSGKDANSLSSDEIQDILIDRKGRLWIATYGGGVNIVPDASGIPRFITPLNGMKGYPLESNGKVRELAEDRDGRIWAATTEGLLLLDFNETDNDVTTRIFHSNHTDKNSLPTNDVISVCCAPDGTLWVGTLGGVCRMTSPGVFETLDKTAGMPSNHIQAVKAAPDGNIWVTTEDNIVCLDPATGRLAIFDELDGISTSMFTERGVFALPSGDILIGALEGCYRINAAKIQTPGNAQGNLRISSIKTSDIRKTKLSNPYGWPESILLTGRHNSLELKLASMDYGEQFHTRYQWRLDNDSIWTETENRTVALSGIGPGNHTLFLRSFSSGNPEEAHVEQVAVYVRIPFWESVWFYVALAVFLGLSTTLYLRKRNLERDKKRPPLTTNHIEREGKIISLSPEEILVDKDEDERFITNLLDWLEKNYHDPDLTIHNMVNAAGMGRTMFYKKLKSLTNLSPVDFLIDFRMKKAKMLMKESKKTIAEIAYLTGYSDPHYFTRAFKTRYQQTPTQYRNKLLGKEQTSTAPQAPEPAVEPIMN